MPSIGDTLREARMRQRLDIADVEAKTKIRAKYLRALENEEFGMLPGPTFVKTFLRSYAEVLGPRPAPAGGGLPGALRAARRDRGPPAARPARDRARPPPPRAAAARARGCWPGSVLAAVLGTLLVIGLVGEDDDGGGAGRARSRPTTQPRRERPERREEPPPPRRVALRIAPEAETYVCIDTGAGTEVRFEGILTAPQTFRGRRLRVNLGNTSVEVTMNGEPVDVGERARPGRLRVHAPVDDAAAARRAPLRT